jgi:hypothetical protein
MKIQPTLKYFSRLSRRCIAPALLLVAMVLPAHAGALLDLYYDYNALPGTGVTNLTADPNFPDNPNNFDVLYSGGMPGLASPLNVFESYGRWIRGYIEAPQTGQYTFWIASDDDSELWLSTDYTAAGKVKIASNVGWVVPHSYFSKPSQRSAPVSLVAGQKYYFEVLHKEDLFGDHVEVAWTLPDGTFQDPVPMSRLWPFPVDTTSGLPPFPAVSSAPTILTSYLGYTVDSIASTTSVQDGQALDLVVTADGTQPAYVQWYSNGVAIPNANLLSWHIAKAGMNQNGAIYSVTITNSLGSASASTTLAVAADSTAPTLVDALNLGNATGDIAVVFSEGVAPATGTNPINYTINNGVTVTGAHLGATPDTVLLQTTGLTVGPAYTVTVNNVRDLASTPNVITPNSQLPIEQYLNTWYRLDESTGTTAADSSGNGRNGTMLNDVIPGYTGKVLKGLKFVGVTGGAVRFPSDFADFSTNGLTIALWAYPTLEGAQANWDRFTDFGNGAAADNILFTRNGTGASVQFGVYKANVPSGAVNTPDGSLLINVWQHFVATMDSGGNVVIYRNGVAAANGTVSVPNVVTRTSNFLGLSNWATDDHFTGKMDDVRVYNRVLSPAAVAALANGGGADDANPQVPSVSVAATVATTALKNTPPGVFTVTRSGYTNVALTVQYTLGGTAANGVVYTNLSGTVVIPAGTNAARVYVTPIDYSFTGVQQSVVLTLTATANYSVADADSATVIIQNNDVSPVASQALADNAIGTVPTTVDVWFAAPVSSPSATTLANYTLVNAPGVSITSATLNSHSLRVVLGLSGPVPAGAQLAVSGVRDAGGNTAPSQIPIRVRLSDPANIVANVYHIIDRPTAFTLMTDGVVNNAGNGGTGFDTWDQGASVAPFAGLLYLTAEDIQLIKVDLGQQFGDGGDWAAQPSVYLLTNAVDTGSTRPDLNTNWTKVNAQFISGGQFQSTGDANPSPNTPIVFDLTGLPASQRTAYGWAVGGVNGNGFWHFLSFTELRAYGASQGVPSTVFVRPPTSVAVVAGQPVKFSAVVESVLPLTVQWQKSLGAGIPNPSLSVVYPDPSYVTESACMLSPVTMADNGAQISLMVYNNVGTFTSQAATLNVLPRTTPPKVVEATYDPSNTVVEVWFDESVESGSAQNAANYTLNDASVSIASAVQDAQGFHVTLTLSGAPTVANLNLTAANIVDGSGNTLASQTVSVLPLAAKAVSLVADAYQQGYATAFSRSTDGVVVHDVNATTWTTFGVAPLGLYANSQFVGLQYAQPYVFGLLKVDLGYQYGDGGDWAAQPRVFILKNPVYTAQTAPENDPANWVQVPAVLTSGSLFDIMPDAPANTVPPPNTPIAFDLSQLPLSQRTGYGWAVGGVPGNGPNAHFVSLAELRAFGTPPGVLPGTGAPQIALDLPSRPIIQGYGSTLKLVVGVSGSQPLYYKWLHNGAALADNGRITGSHASALSVAAAGAFDSGTYQVIITNSFGAVTSAVANVSFTDTALNNGAGWIINSGTTNVPIANNVLTLTDGALSESRSAFLEAPQYIRAFSASWVYQDVTGGGADAVCFVLQNDPRGVWALGGAGGGLGYSGIAPSAALEFNIYTGGTITPGLAFRANGATGAPYDSSAPVNLASGHPIAASLYYNGTTAAVTLKDTVTSGTFSTTYTADLPTLLGANTAYVGFTGGSGGVGAKQVVSNFMFTSLYPNLAIQVTSTNTVVLSWPSAGGALTLQQCSDLRVPNWGNVPNPITPVGSDNQVIIAPQGTSQFYRLRAE